MGMAYEQLNRSTDARSAYENAVRLDPNNKEAEEALKKLGSP